VYVEGIILFLKEMTFWNWKKLPKVFNRKKNAAMKHSLYQVYSPITEMNASNILRYVEKLVKAF